jgi:hypothetical protein
MILQRFGGGVRPMAGFVEGVDRGQSTLFPALLDDYVAEMLLRTAAGDITASSGSQV